jgi:threonine dehydrogenase-like Zn-dependent dehydrogenase
LLVRLSSDACRRGGLMVVEPGLPCRRCVNCKNGRSNICLGESCDNLEVPWRDQLISDMRYCGAPGSVGSLMRYFALPADMAPHIPENVSWEESGSIQPLAVSVTLTFESLMGECRLMSGWCTDRKASRSSCSPDSGYHVSCSVCPRLCGKR